MHRRCSRPPPVAVPILITGTLDNPSYKPDLAGIVGDPSKALNSLKQAVPRLGGGTAPAAPGAPTPPSSGGSLGNTLKGLLPKTN